MDQQPFPLPRATRETETLNGDGSAIYGPFNFKIFDTEDIHIAVLHEGGDWEDALFTATKVAGNEFDDFTIEFVAPLPATSKFVVRSARLHERQLAVTKGGAISGRPLEKELSKQGSVLEELRRDIDRGGIQYPLAPGQVAIMGSDKRMRPGPFAEQIVNAQAEAILASGYADAAYEAQLAAESAAGANLSNVDSRTVAILTHFPSSAKYVRTAGYSVTGDSGGALYRRVPSAPSHSGNFQSADGAWWELTENVPNVLMFGARNGETNQSELMDAVEFAFLHGTELNWPSGEYSTTENIPHFHAVKHMGSGRIKRGFDVFHIQPDRENTNNVYISSEGSPGNDGLSAGQPIDNIDRAFMQITSHRDTMTGTWNYIKEASTNLTFKDNQITNPTVVLIPADFPHLGDAFDFLRKQKFSKEALIDIRLQTGYVITQGVSFQNDDFSQVRIVSDDEEVSVSSSFTGRNATSDIFEQNSLFAGYMSKLPQLHCLINMQTYGGCGYVVAGNSDGFIAGNCGIINAGAFGLYVNNGSRCIAANSRFEYAGWGNRVTVNSFLTAPQADFSRARNATYLSSNSTANLDVSRGSVVYVTGTESKMTRLNLGTGHGLAVRRSFVSATHVDCGQNGRDGLNVGSGGIVAFTGSRAVSNIGNGIVVSGGRVDANDGVFNANGNYNLYADSGGEITARNCNAGGAGNQCVRAANGSRINVSSGSLRKVTGTDGTSDIVATQGSIIHAVGATGGTSITPLTPTGAGLIFK